MQYSYNSPTSCKQEECVGCLIAPKERKKPM